MFSNFEHTNVSFTFIVNSEHATKARPNKWRRWWILTCGYDWQDRLCLEEVAKSYLLLDLLEVVLACHIQAF
jgi:hypothetical protein